MADKVELIRWITGLEPNAPKLEQIEAIKKATEARNATPKPPLHVRYRTMLERNPDPRVRLLDQAAKEAGIDLEKIYRRQDAGLEDDAPTERQKD